MTMTVTELSRFFHGIGEESTRGRFFLSPQRLALRGRREDWPLRAGRSESTEEMEIQQESAGGNDGGGTKNEAGASGSGTGRSSASSSSSRSFFDSPAAPDEIKRRVAAFLTAGDAVRLSGACKSVRSNNTVGVRGPRLFFSPGGLRREQAACFSDFVFSWSEGRRCPLLRRRKEKQNRSHATVSLSLSLSLSLSALFLASRRLFVFPA
jgi:hypothetical protein